VGVLYMCSRVRGYVIHVLESWLVSDFKRAENLVRE